MAEVRIDPLSGQRVFIATDEVAQIRFATDEVAQIRSSSLRGELEPPSFVAILDRAAQPLEPTAYPDLFWAGAATGTHELLEIEEPVRSLGELAPERVAEVMEGWRARMRIHGDAACLHLFSDEQLGTRASAQLLALEFVPALIARERERFRGYATRTMGGNLLADLLQNEVRLRERLVAVDPEVVLLSAYAARVPYQLMIVPRTPRMRFEDDGPIGAAMLHEALRRLGVVLGQIPPLSLWVRTAPQGSEHFCWRIDVLPRLAGALADGGLESGAGLAFNPVSPEAAAAGLRQA
jgi:UDPglucose--hexose-1-phosphate uridylyltransferase